MTSILNSIKKLLGIPESQTSFDSDLIIHINSVLMILNQIGIGMEEGLIVVDDMTQWDDLFEEDQTIELVKTYVYLKVKLIFDPPLSSSVLAAMERTISECEWRLNVKADTTIKEDT